jgi:hypothetical protein
MEKQACHCCFRLVNGKCPYPSRCAETSRQVRQQHYEFNRQWEKEMEREEAEWEREMMEEWE